LSFGLTASIHLESVRVLLIEMNATGEVPNTVKRKNPNCGGFALE
jgi:hypothetical protein